MLVQFFMALLAGVVLYLVLFLFVIQKPLTIGILRDYFDYKVAYIKQIRNEKKIVIFAGSNGRFSHRCETIENEYKIKCANLSIAAGMDINWQLSKYWPYMKKGDILYLPLEYRPEPTNSSTDIGNEAPFIVAYDKPSLLMYHPVQLARAIFYFDLPYVFSGIGEMALHTLGKERRYGTKTLTRQGDESGHDALKAKPYVDFIRTLKPSIFRVAAYDDLSDIEKVLTDADKRGVLVVGGLPTAFTDEVIDKSIWDRLKSLYVSRGHCFVMLKNKSLYPREDFYDTASHLQEKFQIAHTQMLAPILVKISQTGQCPG